MSIIAIRRNLSPGAVFFRQTGQIVEYSLDRETWEIAFLLPSERRTVNPSQFDAIDALTIDQFLTVNNATYNNAITVTNINDIAANQGKLRRNLCTASTLLAAAFVHMVNQVKEETGDAETRFLGAGTALAGGALGLFVLLTPAGWIGAGIATLLGYIAAGLGVGGAAAAFVAEADNVPNLDQDDIELIVCYLLRAASASAADKAAMRGALSQTYSDLSALPAGVEDAWLELWDISPSLYSVWLAGLTDLEPSTCNCGGCAEIIPWDCTIESDTGYKILNGGIKTIPVAPSIEKSLVFNFDIDTGAQVDGVVLNFVTTQYQKANTIGWAGVDCRCRIFGTNGALGYAEKIIPVANISSGLVSANVYAGGIHTLTYDFSDITFTGGTTGSVRIAHKLASGVTGAGADTIFTGGTICYRAP